MGVESINDGTWTDISQQFTAAVKHLKLGELIKSEHFTLLEAMSAIELMDSRMDSGMLIMAAKRKILNLEQSVKNGKVKVSGLSGVELIGIMDETYCCFATWLDGTSLALTVMTNLYLHEPERIEDRFLRIFSQSLLKIVDLMDKLVQVVFCIEEEDFQLNCGRFNLASQYNDQKVLNGLDELCMQIEKQLSSQENLSIHSVRATPINETQDIMDCRFDRLQSIAIIDRLRFTHSLYALLMEIQKSIVRGSWELDFSPSSQLVKIEKQIQNSLARCDHHIGKCLVYLNKWSNTIDLGIKSDKHDASSDKIDDSNIMGFDPLINHKLLPAFYPKLILMKNRKEANEYLVNLILRLRRCTMVAASFNQKSFEESLNLIENLSKYSRPSSCVISRSLAQALYLPNRSGSVLKDVLLLSLSDYCEPQISKIRRDEKGSTALNDFLVESTRSFSQAVIIYGHNVARQYERFPELITSFKNLQYSALIFDSAFSSSVIYSWTTFHLAKLCIKYVLSGLELELFSAHEYPYVFWYLNDILYRNEKEQLELARECVIKNQEMKANEYQKKVKNKKNRKKYQSQTKYHDRSLLCNSAFRLLSGGLFLLTYGLKLQGKIKTPVMDFTSEEICFDHRFGSLTGTPVYNSFQRASGSLDTLETIYQEASACFFDSKRIFETMAQFEDCLKVCKTNMVVAKILSSNLNSFEDRVVEFCFKTHPSFPVVKV